MNKKVKYILASALAISILIGLVLALTGVTLSNNGTFIVYGYCAVISMTTVYLIRKYRTK